MLHGHAVHKARRRQRHISHVEHSVVAAAHALQQVGDFPAENPVGLLHGEAVMSGRYRGVGSEYTTAAHRLGIPLLMARLMSPPNCRSIKPTVSSAA